MFFRSKDAQWLIDSGHKTLNAFLNTAEEAGSDHMDRDAAIMFAGFIHFSVGFYISRGRINSDDVGAILQACALHVRHYAPDAALSVSYLEDTRQWVEQAIETAQRHPIQWIAHYYRLVRSHVSIDEGSFCGALTAHVAFAMQRLSR